jgi:hypothetical protein
MGLRGLRAASQKKIPGISKNAGDLGVGDSKAVFEEPLEEKPGFDEVALPESFGFGDRTKWPFEAMFACPGEEERIWRCSRLFYLFPSN